MAVGLIVLAVSTHYARAEKPLTNWSDWQRCRASISHPCLTIKPADLERARKNLERYAWAKTYRDDLVGKADGYADRFTPGYVERMIEPTTPLSLHFTPCPACRDQHKPYQPHGHWKWSPEKPDQVTCDVCGAVFPNAKYPESVVIKTTWGAPQSFTFAGGEPFEIFGYKTGRPSFSGLIRAQKVNFMVDSTRQLAEAYLLTRDERYARACKTVLLRLAEVFPHWLVHSGYGEIADMDPRVAAEMIKKLPKDESVYPPNQPDRQLHTGYWSAGRATGTGVEGRVIRLLAETYDFTCGSPAYSDADRIKIEHDLLLEGTVLLTADPQINNKAVSNRSAAGMVGMVCGQPDLVRFALDGFKRTVDEWFLPDGGTPESTGYAMMTFNGVNDFALAAAGYSDPPGYHDAKGKRLDGVDLFHGTAYEKAWSAEVNGLQGDLTLPHFADGRPESKIGSSFVDVLVQQYPDRSQYLALLKELCGKDLRSATPPVALYHREPGLEDRSAPPLTLPDVCLPDLRIGHLRTGADGRESLLLLSASHWGAHHHQDSLNLYYWKDGQELLSDLGYLWDNPNKHMTVRTLAHNTVLVDAKDQEKETRGGDVRFFETAPHVKVMRASSQAYPKATRYERTSAIIDHGDGNSYVVDVFAVEGGDIQDFVFHGPNEKFALEGGASSPSKTKLYDFTNVRSVDATSPWSLTWTMPDDSAFTAWSLPQRHERALVGDGWGQRDPYNKDVGRTIPYVVRRCEGASLKQFVSVFEGHPATKPFVRSVARKKIDGGVALEVETAAGRDYIQSDASAFDVTSSTGDTTNWTFHHHE